jgi:hypothetical protein
VRVQRFSNELIQEMIALPRPEVSKHSILIGSDFSIDLPPIMAHRVQLQQVLMHLMLMYPGHEEHEHAGYTYNQVTAR